MCKTLFFSQFKHIFSTEKFPYKSRVFTGFQQFFSLLILKLNNIYILFLYKKQEIIYELHMR